jgi:hypothetical protein
MTNVPISSSFVIREFVIDHLAFFVILVVIRKPQRAKLAQTIRSQLELLPAIGVHHGLPAAAGPIFDRSPLPPILQLH